MGYMGMCSSKGYAYGVSTVSVINSVWCCTLVLNNFVFFFFYHQQKSEQNLNNSCPRLRLGSSYKYTLQ